MAMPAMPHRFTVDDYVRMVETGILTEDDRVELLDGEIVEMTPAGPRHAAVVARLQHRLTQHAGSRVVVWVQSPIQLRPRNTPEPDVAVLRPRADFYDGALPAAADVLLVIEVADSTLITDRNRKIPAYAEAGIPGAWIVNLVANHIQVFRDPAGRTYRTVTEVAPGAVVSALALPDLTLPVEEILGV